MKILFLALLLGFNSAHAFEFIWGFGKSNEELSLSDYSTDGCSSYPDGLFLYDPNRWVHCCITHDMAYWVGGDKEVKKAADTELNRCVAEVTSELHGKVMEIGVAAGGIPNTPFPWRWGYGWNKDVSYELLSPEMQEMMIEKFDTILDTLIEHKSWLDNFQKGYVIGRYELLRHEALKAKGYEYETKDFDERYQKVLNFLE